MRFIAILVLLLGCEAVNPEIGSDSSALGCVEAEGQPPCCDPPRIDSIVCPEGSSLQVVGDVASCHTGAYALGMHVTYREGGVVYGESLFINSWETECVGGRMAVTIMQTSNGPCVAECYQPEGGKWISCSDFAACD